MKSKKEGLMLAIVAGLLAVAIYKMITDKEESVDLSDGTYFGYPARPVKFVSPFKNAQVYR